MIRLLLVILVFSLLVPARSAVVDDAMVSRYTVTRTRVPMVIDGVLSDKEWKSAPTIGFYDIGDPSRPIKEPIAARMMWDDTCLYIAYDCVDRDIWNPSLRHDDPVYNGDNVEAFIDPDGSGRHYMEIEVSPSNVVLDIDILRPEAVTAESVPILARYDMKGLRTAVRVRGTVNQRDDRDTGWTVEMAVPWSDFAWRKIALPPKPGSSWRVQLLRLDYTKDEAIGQCSSSPSPGVFHEPRNFGIITFAGR